MRLCVTILSENDEELQCAAAAVLMSMCNGTRDPDTGENACKPEAVKAGAVGALAPLLQNGISLELAGEMSEKTCALTVYVLKAMAALADAPKGRKQLHAAALEQVRVLSTSVEPLVQKSALIALDRITWTP